MAHRILSHTADIGIEATAPTLEALLAELASGMFTSMAHPRPGATRRPVTVARVESATVEDLAVDVLSELLGCAEVEDLHLCDFEIGVSGHVASLRAVGVPRSQTEALGPPVKAVTYHRLLVEPRGEGWYGRVYFDV